MTISDLISEACSELTSLAEEMRERADNTPENLQCGQTYQTVDETASELENVSEPDVPEGVADIPVTRPKQSKRRRKSRATRCAEACDLLHAAIAGLEDYLEESDPDSASAKNTAPEPADTKQETEDKRAAAETLRDKCQEIVDACESLEFPGMYG